jgi:hypothetical protein
MGLFSSKSAVSEGASVADASSGSSGMSTGRILGVVAGILMLLLLGFVFYNYMRTSQGLAPVTVFPTGGGASASADQAPAPVDGKTRTVISANNVPLSTGSNYGVQFWMFISDWDYQFGKEKLVLTRTAGASDSIVNPSISLHPTDNSLNVRVSIFPTDSRAGAASPGALNGSATGDSYTCTVENVPLQSWFAVSVTVFQRNLDVYINGRLVKSAVLPGVPKPAVGDIVLNDKGGFSGSVCNVHSYSSMLKPEDAKAFFAAGTTCQAPAPTTPGPITNDGFITLFGYTFKFATLDKSGKELSSLTL